MSTIRTIAHSAKVGDLPPEEVIFGQTVEMQAVRRKVEKVATANVPVLIQGENGTGKEVIATVIHCRSPWGSGPFVKVNCAAIPGTLLESELFGYEKGAFTGANNCKPGRVELANHGTLFLDEITELDHTLQAKLLQLLQDGQFCRIGGQEERHVEVRVICATNRDPSAEIEAGTFRRDLFYRINVLNLRLPALRERKGDIPNLMGYFLDLFQQKFNREVAPLSRHVLQLLEAYPWPGNIRELENLMKRYVILGSEEVIISELMAREPSPASPAMRFEGSVLLKKISRQAAQELERKVIAEALAANNWNQKRTAQALNISYRALLYKIRQAGLPSKRSGSFINRPPPAD